MNEKYYKKRFEFQKNIITKQADEIDSLKSQIELLRLECEKKDEKINSVNHLKDEMVKRVSEVKTYQEEYKKLIDDLKKMKKVMNQELFKGRWFLVKLLIK